MLVIITFVILEDYLVFFPLSNGSFHMKNDPSYRIEGTGFVLNLYSNIWWSTTEIDSSHIPNMKKYYISCNIRFERI